MAPTGRRPISRGTAVICSLLDAAAFQLDLGAAEGRAALIRGPMAIGIRTTSRLLRFWNACWVGRYLGLAWLIRTYRLGHQPPRYHGLDWVISTYRHGKRPLK